MPDLSQLKGRCKRQKIYGEDRFCYDLMRVQKNIGLQIALGNSPCGPSTYIFRGGDQEADKKRLNVLTSCQYLKKN
jgi:hypothetical protein